MNTRKCTPATVAGRLNKAKQFLVAADTIAEVLDQDDDPDIGDAFVTLCVHAGIAAADVLCCKALGEHATGARHEDAKELLRRVDTEAARHLGTLLEMKTLAAYTHRKVSSNKRKQAERAARNLVARAEAT